MEAREGEEEEEGKSRKPKAVFMAFGTKGDVYPLAAIAAAFARDQEQYDVVLITHSAHQNLSSHLEGSYVAFVPIDSPPVLSVHEHCGDDDDDTPGMLELEVSFSQRKIKVMRAHKQECYSAVKRLFGDGPTAMGDFIVINFFALEGWSLAELFHVRCMVAAPYVVPYCAPSSFEKLFRKEHPLLYHHLQEAPPGKVCWKDVIHWMWPLFTENWGSWRSEDLSLSPCPLTDSETGLPSQHDWPPSPLLLYGFSKQIVECPGYWPLKVHVCGFWCLPIEWQFSCKKCARLSEQFSLKNIRTEEDMCSAHLKLLSFLELPDSTPPVFIGLSSVGSMGFLKKPEAFLRVIQVLMEITSHRFVLFTAGYELLDEAIQVIAGGSSYGHQKQHHQDGIHLFNGRLFCFSCLMPYQLLFPRCAVAIHHGGSGSTAAALYAGISQVICPFILDQFYWAERMHWLGVAAPPVKRQHLVPDKLDDLCIRFAANMVSRAINDALRAEVRSRASEIAASISVEDGVKEAVEILEQEMRIRSD